MSIGNVSGANNDLYLVKNTIRKETKSEDIKSAVTQALGNDGAIDTKEAEALFNLISKDGIITKDEVALINNELKKANLELECFFDTQDPTKFNFNIKDNSGMPKIKSEKFDKSETVTGEMKTGEKKEGINIKTENQVLTASNKKVEGLKDKSVTDKSYDVEFQKLPLADKFFAINNKPGATSEAASDYRWKNGFQMDTKGTLSYYVSDKVKLSAEEKKFIDAFNKKTPEEKKQVYMQVIQSDFNFNNSNIKDAGTFTARMKENKEVYSMAIKNLGGDINNTDSPATKKAQKAYEIIASKVFEFMKNGPDTGDLTIGNVQAYMAALAPDINATSTSNNETTGEKIAVKDPKSGVILASLPVLDGLDGTATQREKRHIADMMEEKPPEVKNAKMNVSFNVENSWKIDKDAKFVVDTSGSMNTKLSFLYKLIDQKFGGNNDSKANEIANFRETEAQGINISKIDTPKDAAAKQEVIDKAIQDAYDLIGNKEEFAKLFGVPANDIKLDSRGKLKVDKFRDQINDKWGGAGEAGLKSAIVTLMNSPDLPPNANGDKKELYIITDEPDKEPQYLELAKSVAAKKGYELKVIALPSSMEADGNASKIKELNVKKEDAVKTLLNTFPDCKSVEDVQKKLDASTKKHTDLKTEKEQLKTDRETLISERSKLKPGSQDYKDYTSEIKEKTDKIAKISQEIVIAKDEMDLLKFKLSPVTTLNKQIDDLSIKVIDLATTEITVKDNMVTWRDEQYNIKSEFDN